MCVCMCVRKRGHHERIDGGIDSASTGVHSNHVSVTPTATVNPKHVSTPTDRLVRCHSAHTTVLVMSLATASSIYLSASTDPESNTLSDRQVVGSMASLSRPLIGTITTSNRIWPVRPLIGTITTSNRIWPVRPLRDNNNIQ